MRRVVVLGGGIGGVTAAAELSKRLRGLAEVTIVDRDGKHYFPPAYPWLAMGWRKPDQLWKPLVMVKARDVRVRQERVTAIDTAERKVTTDRGEIVYDHLLIALGAQVEPRAIEGLAQAAHHPYDLDGAVRLGHALREFRRGRVLVGISRLPFKCPAAPYEMALLMESYFRQKGKRDQVEMEFFSPEPWPTPSAGESIGRRVEGLLRQRGIGFYAKREMDHVDPESKVVQFKGHGQAPYDLLIAVPPHTTCEAVRDSDLAKDGPWIPVDRYTLRSSYDDVYAVGDVTKIPTPSGKVPALPKAGVFAEGQAKVAARNIAADIAGGQRSQWDGFGTCFLETGHGKAGMVRGNFYGEGPAPSMRNPGRLWHWGKVFVEKRWWSKRFR